MSTDAETCMMQFSSEIFVASIVKATIDETAFVKHYKHKTLKIIKLYDEQQYAGSIPDEFINNVIQLNLLHISYNRQHSELFQKMFIVCVLKKIN